MGRILPATQDHKHNLFSSPTASFVIIATASRTCVGILSGDSEKGPRIVSHDLIIKTHGRKHGDLGPPATLLHVVIRPDRILGGSSDIRPRLKEAEAIPCYSTSTLGSIP